MAVGKLTLLLFPLYLCAATSFEQFKQQQDQEFKQKKLEFIDFKKAEDKAFKEHMEKEKSAIAAYRKKLKVFWPEADLGNAKKLVSYSKDLKTQSIIDYEHNEIKISTLYKDETSAKRQLLETLQKTLELDNTQAFDENEMEQDIDRLSKISKYVKRADLDSQKLIKTPFTKKTIRSEDIILLKKKDSYQVTYKLPRNSTYQRSANYLVSAKSNAQRFRLQPHWLLAIMHSESSFNPMARSWVPAYGLMQIVPRTAGIDSYYFLYKKRRLLSASYLYNTKNNIETGSAYLHILYYKYLSAIKDPTSRLYCAIAGYNTGAGNVARAFVGTNNVQKAAAVINTMRPQQVYDYLLRKLPYEETRHYLKRVHTRSQKYQTLYKL
jgi:membrane-bound lytic murein transglycosylase C